ncbi:MULTISPECIES: endonuclease/exonuclease/phosphatase family protein [unclassified Crossiella]|uniref:endonuclease/exonuclease/phosphatase family protein n=1 Tax=unclassified Crossiella TaxID=2620835 RepID=UPI001FFF5188|nr:MULTISPECIES: endonuclease/exonuclease/phosphatase family protein [unclassified Crossiella]MCK2240096.1 hypothetical protein [Crossiella sp. S99.2]MCK2252805.1 hypothetical protein [Crossiella sp. S99.1]
MFWNLYERPDEEQPDGRTRREQQAAVIRRVQPDVLAVTEGWGWATDSTEEFAEAFEAFGFSHGDDHVELYSSKTRCCMALAVARRSGIQVVRAYHQPQAEAWWHGYLQVTLGLPRHGQVELIVAHLNPYDPTLQRIESSWLRNTLRPGLPSLIVMDANCVPPGDPEPDLSVKAAHQIGNSRQLGAELVDRAPLEALAASGWRDVGAEFGNRRPTAGYYSPNDVPRRLDLAWTAQGLAVSGYRVLDDLQADPELNTASDHRPLIIEL